MLKLSGETFLTLAALASIVFVLGGFAWVPRWLAARRLEAEERRLLRARAREAEERALNEQLADAPARGVFVPLLVTAKMAAELRAHGVTDAEIAQMTPAVAHRMLEILRERSS